MWSLSTSDRITHRLDIDSSVQFERAKKFKKIVEYTINFDLCTNAHELTDGVKTIKFLQNSFFSKYCDIKIGKIINNDSTTNNSQNLFKSCLFAMQPIYYCLQNKSGLFVDKQVQLDLLGRKKVRLPSQYLTAEHFYLVDSLSTFDLNMCGLPKKILEFWSCFTCSLFTHPLQDFAYKTYIKRWHLENNVALPQLCIESVSDETFLRLLNFFSFYLSTFYNQHLFLPNTKKMIMACWAEKIKNPTFLKTFDNNKMSIKKGIVHNGILTKSLTLFPGILVKQLQDHKFEYCLFYQSNVINFSERYFLLIEYTKMTTKEVHLDKVFFNNRHQVTFLIDGIDQCDYFKIHLKSQHQGSLKINFNKKSVVFNNQNVFTVKKNQFDDSFRTKKPVAGDEFVLLAFPNDSKIHFQNLQVKEQPFVYQPVGPSTTKSLVAINSILKQMPKTYTYFVNNLDLAECLNNFYNIELTGPLPTNSKFKFDFVQNADNFEHISIRDLDVRPYHYWTKQYVYEKNTVTDHDMFFAQLQFFGSTNRNLPSNMYARVERSEDNLDIEHKTLDMFGASSPNTLNKYLIISSIYNLAIAYNHRIERVNSLTSHHLTLNFTCQNDFEKSRKNIYGGIYHIIMINFTVQYNEKVGFSFIENSVPFTNHIDWKYKFDRENDGSSRDRVSYIADSPNLKRKIYIYIILTKYTFNQTAHLAFELDSV
jgi:hypothetical protein